MFKKADLRSVFKSPSHFSSYPRRVSMATVLVPRFGTIRPCEWCGKEVDTDRIGTVDSGIMVDIPNEDEHCFCQWSCLLAGIPDETIGDYSISKAHLNRGKCEYIYNMTLCAHCGIRLPPDDFNSKGDNYTLEDYFNTAISNHIVVASDMERPFNGATSSSAYYHFCSVRCLKYGRRILERDAVNAYFTDTPASEMEESSMDVECDDYRASRGTGFDRYDEQKQVRLAINRTHVTREDAKDTRKLKYYGFKPIAVVE